jgi:hypothetical protein
MKWTDLKEAREYETYKEYVKSRKDFGLSVMPISLFEKLKEK